MEQRRVWVRHPSDAFSTGSSIMPQKKNPDPAALIRGKSGRCLGNLVSLLTMIKGLPLAYNKDMQEDKEGLFDSVRTLQGALQICDGFLKSATFNSDRMHAAALGSYSNATDMADYSAKKGIPFRQAHEIVGKLVRSCVERKLALEQLPLAELQAASAVFGDDVFEALSLACVSSRRASFGGTAPSAVAAQLQLARQALEAKI